MSARLAAQNGGMQMTIPRWPARRTALTLITLALIGCGQTGPLYRPGEAPPGPDVSLPQPSDAEPTTPSAEDTSGEDTPDTQRTEPPQR